MTAVSAATRALVLERDNHTCVRCGVTIAAKGLGVSIHHRRARGMGGSKDPRLSLPSNLLTLCGSGTTGCHGRVESHRREATALGFLLRAVKDAETTRVHTAFGWKLYGSDGSVSDA